MASSHPDSQVFWNHPLSSYAHRRSLSGLVLNDPGWSDCSFQASTCVPSLCGLLVPGGRCTEILGCLWTRGRLACLSSSCLHLCARVNITCAPGGILGLGGVLNNRDLVELPALGPFGLISCSATVFLSDCCHLCDNSLCEIPAFL